MPLPDLHSHRPLAPLTTLRLGGAARWFVEARKPVDLVAALRWARESGVEAFVLGGGSNVVVADSGLDGLVVRLALRGVEKWPEGGTVRVTAAAGEPWDALVRSTVEEGLAGLECLSGIPGTVGASPVQNVGAYGQEVADVIETVRVLDRESLEERSLTAAECGFGYRDSRFRRHPARFVVLAVTFRLTPGGAPTVRYPELARAVTEAGSLDGRGEPTVRALRETVLTLRRSKSMVIEAEDPDRRSVGSFFVNPVIAAEEAQRVAERAAVLGVVRDPSEVPRFRVEGEPGRTKLSAGWLIEAVGFRKGERWGAVGISSRHALALVHHGGGRTAGLVRLAREIRGRVRERFGVTLRPEPVFLGFGEGDPLED